MNAGEWEKAFLIPASNQEQFIFHKQRAKLNFMFLIEAFVSGVCSPLPSLCTLGC
jgi:hypothetical protein